MDIVKRVAVELGGATRHLVYDFNAFAAMEEETGREFGLLFDDLLSAVMATKPNPDDPDGEPIRAARMPKASLVRTMVWAGLLHEAPSLTVREVGSWLHTNNLPAVVSAMTQAFTANAPEGKPSEANPPAAPSEAPPVADAV